MAWISIQEQVTGPKLRKFAKKVGCTQNEALGLLVRLWLWSIRNIEQDGLLKNMERCDLAEIINIGLNKTYDPEIIVDAMIETGWIDEDGGRLFIHEWYEWQKYYYTYNDKNKKAAARMRKTRAAKEKDDSEETDGAITEEEAIEDPGNQKTPDLLENSVTDPPAGGTESSASKESPQKYSEPFEAFWSVYPRKKEKADTYEKYKARLKDGFDEATLLQAATAYRDECQRKNTEMMYIKLGKTFLSNKLPFMDYVNDKGQMMAPKGGTTGSRATYDDPFGDWR